MTHSTGREGRRIPQSTMKSLQVILLSAATLAGFAILVAQEAGPAPDAKPAAAVTRPAALPSLSYDYRVEMLIPPTVNPNGGQAGPMPQLPNRLSDYEIVNVSVVKANASQSPNDPNPPKTREVLIYTLRKPR